MELNIKQQKNKPITANAALRGDANKVVVISGMSATNLKTSTPLRVHDQLTTFGQGFFFNLLRTP